MTVSSDLNGFASTPSSHPTRHSQSERRSERRASRAKQKSGSQSAPKTRGIDGGRFAPLHPTDMTQIDAAVREILANVGLSEAPPTMIELVTNHGGQLLGNGRLTFPERLFDEAILGLQRDFTLCGQTPDHDLLLSGKRVYVGTGGAAPHIVDLETGQYRDSTLRDLYDAARLVDVLENVHFFSRSLVARDMPDDLTLDINTAYACLAGTTKHICTSITLPAHVQPVADLCFAIAGSQEAFVDRPFLSLNINHVAPPMRFAADACEVMAAAARLGIPVHSNSFGQVGASSPVTLAGSIVQNVAEVLAGMIFAWLVNPEAKVIFGARPMITDLRTGSMTGGSGEQALLMAAATQMAQFYNLPNTCIAGATDSKIPDAQSGYEKSLSITLAAQAGSNMITQACGMQASLMGCALESYVIDNDMLGGILRSISPIEINEATLATEAIAEIVGGEGHFLGHPETFKRMQSDFLYPQIGDRRSPQEWADDGAPDIWRVAKHKTRQILSDHFPNHITHETDHALRARFDIRLPESAMIKGLNSG